MSVSMPLAGVTTAGRLCSKDVVWQPRYTLGAPVADRESINHAVFSFVGHQLFRIAVVYDRGRTSGGLTGEDMIAAL